jgi:hypothetical protein
LLLALANKRPSPAAQRYLPFPTLLAGGCGLVVRIVASASESSCSASRILRRERWTWPRPRSVSASCTLPPLSPPNLPSSAASLITFQNCPNSSIGTLEEVAFE